MDRPRLINTTDRNKEPLLQYMSPRKNPPAFLYPLPEEGVLSTPIPITPSGIKDRLIFGRASFSPTSDSSILVDASTPRPSSSNLHEQQQPFLQDPKPEEPSQSESAHTQSVEKHYQHPHLHRCRTAPAVAVINDGTKNTTAIPKPHLASQFVIRQAFVLLMLYLLLGVLIYCFNRGQFLCNETHPVVDALYFCIVTMCTIGYGDIIPNSPVAKLFSVFFVLVGFGFIDILLSGMVTYMLDLQENYMLRAVKPGAGKGKSIIIDVKKGRMRIRLKVGLALGVVVLCIGMGVVTLHFVEKLGWLDSFYLSVMSVTTVGYGDKAFKTMPGRMFAAIWLLVSTLAVARAFLYLTEARVDSRHRKMAKWVLGQDLTVAQFLAADIDNNGSVSKSEYVIYKLKEMQKVTEKDIMQISLQFDRIDTTNSGKISLTDLM